MRPEPVPASVRRAPAALLTTCALLGAGAAAETTPELLARGDAAWARRAEGAREARAEAGPVGEAVAAYGHALETSPDSIAVRERLLRALYFQARFATPAEPARRAIYDHGRRLAEEGIARLAVELGPREPLDPRSPAATAAAVATRPESAALFFWAAAHWGLWAESSGAFAAARQGVAGRIRDYAETTILVDERYETGGGHRILGRLHTEAPRIPLVTGWVDRDLAVASLERAIQLAPDDPLNRLYLADALLRFRPPRRREAVTMLEKLIAEPPRPESVIQDRKTLADARQLLAGAGGGG